MTTNKLKYEFYIGCNDKDTKKDNTTMVLKNVQKLFDSNFECYTLDVAQGRYKYNNGQTVNENTCIIKVIHDKTINKTWLKYFCELLKDVANQESILVTVSKVRGELY